MVRIDHARVAAWLKNFPAAQRGVAGDLIDALSLISETDLRRELGGHLALLVDKLQTPVAAFPAREVDPARSAHEAGRDGAYHLLEPGLPGSEAIIGNILTGVVRRRGPSAHLLSLLDLATLRDRKVKTMLLVDDFSGSGKRLLDFHSAMLRHPTVRSWTSFGWIKFHVAAFAATTRAIALLERRFGKERVHIVRACPTFLGTGWTPEQQEEVERLCLAHAGRSNRRRALGFRDSRALIAFEHTAPNNLPYILWKRAENWNSLFEDKAVPSDLLPLFTMRPTPVHGPLAGSAGAARLGQIVDLLARRVRNVAEIAEITDISIAEVKRLIDLVKQLSLANQNLRLTDAGRIELKKWRLAHPDQQLPNRAEAYYPRELRAER
ncbi:phosphoribosyltransferase-like protein [Sphingomonas sp. RS6]